MAPALEHLCGTADDVACPECRRIRQIVAQRRLREYGWTPEEYEAARVAQGYRCAICGRHEDTLKNALHADHCHLTGAKRGLLCTNCNNRFEPVITAYCSDPDLRARWDRYLAIS